MEPARLRAYNFRDCRRKGNYVVANFGFNFVNALHVEVGPLMDGFRRVFRHHACFGQSFGGRNFHHEPGAKTVLVTPDSAHLRARVSWNQAPASRSALLGATCLAGFCETWDIFVSLHPQKKELGILNGSEERYQPVEC